MVTRAKHTFRKDYVRALEALVGRKLTPSDGYSRSDITDCEKRIKLKLPAALRDYYEVAGKHAINVEHNRLYTPRRLKVMDGKLAFMEENQVVVFWGVAAQTIPKADPEVFQACNELPLVWYPERVTFSEFIIRMLRWERGEGEPW